MKKSRWWLKLLIALAVIGVVGALLYNFVLPKPAQSLSMSYDAINAARGDFEVKIQGTGNIQTSKTVDIIAHRGGEVKGLEYEAGDAVIDGALFAELYDEALENTISQQEADIKQQGINMSKIKDTLKDFQITAPASGRIKKLEAKEGEQAAPIVSAHGALCVISPDGKMKVTIPFTSASRAGTVAKNQKIYVRVDGVSYDGEISELTQSSLTVELESDNFDIGAKAEVYQDAVLFDKFGEGKLEVVNAIAVSGSGRIVKSHISEGQLVSRGDVLFSLDDSEARKTISSSDVMRDYAQDSLEKNLSKLEDNKIYCTHSGIIQSLNIKNGQFIQQGALVATVVDNKNTEVVIEVDELDIPRVELGQTVEISVDALPDEEFSGTVTKISELGKIVNTVTTYDVTISLKAERGIKIGMTANAEILVDSRSGVISVPRTAIIVQGGQNVVRVLPGGEAAFNEVVDMTNPNAALPEIEYRPVTLGLKSGSTVEIVDGLNEGDLVLTEKEQASSAFSMMMGGGGGNRPPENGGGNVESERVGG